MHDITTYIKDVLKTLRELKKSSGLAFEMLKLLSDGQESSAVMALNYLHCIPNFQALYTLQPSDLLTTKDLSEFPIGHCRTCGAIRRSTR